VALYDAAAPGRLRHRRTELVELTGAATELSALAGEPVPAAVFVNAGDWALGQVTIDDRSLAALAGVAFDVGDPLTEAACWNAAWHMVLTAQLAAADYAALVARRLSNGTPCAPLAPSAVEALLGRALTCADRYVPRDRRAAVRTIIADAALSAARAPSVPGPLRRALLAGFAASAQTDAHLAIIRALLDGDTSASAAAAAPTALTLRAAPAAPIDLTLRAALVRALAIRDLASPADLASLTDADPVAGRPLRTTCEAARPDPAAKEAAWTATFDEQAPQWLARAHAAGIWIAGQESVLDRYRDRYFRQALPALSARDARGDRLARRLADVLFPVTLDEEPTMTAVQTAIEADGLTARLRAILQTQEAELRTAAKVRRA
jgi:aminopeptidase N